jgi:hypothetical protein
MKICKKVPAKSTNFNIFATHDLPDTGGNDT